MHSSRAGVVLGAFGVFGGIDAKGFEHLLNARGKRGRTRKNEVPACLALAYLRMTGLDLFVDVARRCGIDKECPTGYLALIHLGSLSRVMAISFIAF